MDTELDLSRDGSALLRRSGAADSDDGLELWVDGAFCQPLELLRGGPAALGRVNRLARGARPLAGWKVTVDDASRSCSVNCAPEWTLNESDTAYLCSAAPDGTSTAVFECPVQGRQLTICPGEAYRLVGYFAAHRCAGSAQVTFLDEQGRKLGAYRTEVPQPARGGRVRSDYARVIVKARAPEHASTMSLEIIKGSTVAGENSYLFFTELALTRGEESPRAEETCLDFSPQLTAKIFAAPAEIAIFRPVWPSLLTSGKLHDIAVVDRRSGARFERQGFSAPLSAQARLDACRLEGSTLLGRFSLESACTEALAVELWIDGVFSSALSIAAPRDGDVIRLPLPLTHCDGRPHLFQVRGQGDGRLLGQIADFGPNSLTPWTSLQLYCGSPLPIDRAPAMEHRYRALRDGLRELTAARVAEGDQSDLQSRLQTLMLSHDLVAEGFAVKRRALPPLIFPLVSAPKVSVVIPVHNRHEVTYNCLASLLLARNTASFEVVLVDDGSSDQTTSLGEAVRNITYIRNQTALGFVGACNRGAEAARGEYIVLLNNDTEPTAGWLDELLFVFDSFDNVGLVGSKLLYPDGKLQEAGGIVWETGDPWNYGRGENPHEPRFCYTREVDYVSGAALMIPRIIWKVLGGLSAEFAPAYFEDTDLAFKVKASGRRVVFAPFSIVYHFEGLSNGTDPLALTGQKRFQEVNRPKFKRKWAPLYRVNGQVGVDLDLAKDRGVALRAVMLDDGTPRIDNDAGSYAAIQEIRLLQSLGFKVTFVPSNLAYLGRHTELLQRMGVEVIYAPYFQSLQQFVESRATEFDLVFVTRYKVAQRAAELFRRAVPKTPIVCNVADLYFLRAIREAALGPCSSERLEEIGRGRDDELDALSKVDLALTYSPVEQGVIVSHSMARTKVALLPWVVDPVAPPLFRERDGLAFLGGFDHSPNVSAVEFFVCEVMPLVRERLPGVTFRVYGSNIPDALLKLSAEDVIFEGYVADVREVFDQCRVFVAPLLYGAGVKGKVVDCIAAGVPAVLSSVAGEALPISDGVEALLADRPQDWVEAIACLYNDETRWRAMSRAMLDLAERAFSFEHGRKMMQEALEQVDLYTSGLTGALCVNRARPSLASQGALTAYFHTGAGEGRGTCRAPAHLDIVQLQRKVAAELAQESLPDSARLFSPRSRR